MRPEILEDAYRIVTLTAMRSDHASRFAAERPNESVPKKIPSVSASTANCPNMVPEQPATASGAIAARYQGVSLIVPSVRAPLVATPTCKIRYDSLPTEPKM